MPYEDDVYFNDKDYYEFSYDQWVCCIRKLNKLIEIYSILYASREWTIKKLQIRLVSVMQQPSSDIGLLKIILKE